MNLETDAIFVVCEAGNGVQNVICVDSNDFILAELLIRAQKNILQELEEAPRCVNLAYMTAVSDFVKKK